MQTLPTLLSESGISSLSTSSRYITAQIICKTCFVCRVNTGDGSIISHCCRLKKTKVSDNVILLGRSTEVFLEDSLVSYIQNLHTNFSSPTALLFQRCIVNGTLFYSKSYKQTQKKNSFTIAYQGRQIVFGQIEHFLCISCNDSNFVYAYITQFEKQGSNRTHFNLLHDALDYNLSRIVPVSMGNKILVDVNCFLCKCAYVNVSSQSYVCVPPNTLSVD